MALLFVVVVGAALGVGAWQLASAQSRDRADLRDRYAARATVASSLVDSLFVLAFGQQSPITAKALAGPPSSAKLDALAKRNQALYTALIDSRGQVLASSANAPPALKQGATYSPSFIALSAKTGYSLSGVMGSGKGAVVESATRLPGPGGRIAISASALKVFLVFLSGSIKPLAPIEGGDAYVLDSRGMVLGAVSAKGKARPPDPKLIAPVSRGEKRGTYDSRGRHFFASTELPSTGWHIALSAPTSSLYGPASGTSRWLPWVVLALCALAFLAVAYLIRRTVIAGERLALANRDLGRTNSELQRSNADLEQFAYVASHDLSAPLRAVAGFSQLLASRYGGQMGEDADEFIRHMKDGVDRMQRIIDDLLSYSRVDRSELSTESVDLGAVLVEVLRGLGPEIEERGAIVTSDPLPTVRGEAGQLGQVLQNLIANGIKFTAPGVTPAVHVSARRDGECWCIAVHDNGIGVDAEHGEQIFKMFQRLHGPDDYPGTGIGLAIAKRIVERHGGSLRVEPGDEGGSVFSFSLQDRVPRAIA